MLPQFRRSVGVIAAKGEKIFISYLALGNFYPGTAWKRLERVKFAKNCFLLHFGHFKVGDGTYGYFFSFFCKATPQFGVHVTLINLN